MTSYDRVHPDCVNASNPYHECSAICMEKISSGQGRKEKKKSGSLLGSSFRFRKKRTNSESQPQSPAIISNGTLAKPSRNSEIPSPRSPFSGKKVIDAYNSQSSTSSRPPTADNHSEIHSAAKDSDPCHEIVPASELVSSDCLASYAFGTLARSKQNGKADTSENISLVSKNDETVSSVSKSFNFSLSGLSQYANSEDEDSISVVSDSYVSVGKYNVRPYLATTLQSILDKYGDIGANSCLESISLRSYHMECVSSVVHELESTPVNQLTKAKVKEMLAVLKDVEAAQVDVSWLRNVLDEHKEIIELSNQYQSAEAAREECDVAVESVKKEIELLEVELREREELVAACKSKIEETRCRLAKMEVHRTEVNSSLSSAKARLEKFHGKPLAQGIL